MTDTAISIDGLWKKFRVYHDRNQYLKSTLLRGQRADFEEFWAVRDASLAVKGGSTFGIVGPNGSGKSTLLKCLAGVLVPDKGAVTVRGRFSALLELGAGFHPDLTGRENISLNGAILGMSRREILQKLDQIVEFSGLERFIDSPVKNYSSGMVVRLGFAIAINVDPEILLIDEVLAVGDESFQQRCFEKIISLRNDGRTIVLVSHGLSQVAQLCQEVAWIEGGQIRDIGRGLDVVQRYTGASHMALESTGDEVGERWGTFEAEIRQVRILDVHGTETRSLITTQSYSISIDYEVHSEIADLVVGVRVTHSHGTVIWGTNTKRRGLAVDSKTGSGRISLDLERLPLLEGTYGLTIALSDSSEIHEFDHWEKRLQFTVSQDGIFDEGLVLPSARWSS